MTSACWICLDLIGTEKALVPGPHGSRYHADCLVALFGTKQLPRLALLSDQIAERAREMIGKLSLSGAQPKLSLALSDPGDELIVTPTNATYILKPPSDRYRHVPENEHVSMQLARLMGIRTATCGLVPLGDGALALIVRRFDRTGERPPRKLLLEDFCSLAGMKKEHKHLSSAEACMKLARCHTTEPEAAAQELFCLLLFSYWIGNGDLHLKNLSLLRDPSGTCRLSPAYDLVNTAVVHGDALVALSVRARQRDLGRHDWLAFAEDPPTSLNRDEAAALIDQMLAFKTKAEEAIQRSALPATQQQQYIRVLRKRARALT